MTNPTLSAVRRIANASMISLGVGLTMATNPALATDSVPGGANSSANSSAQALQAHYTSIAGRLANNVFNRPLTLDSVEAPGQLSGDIHAVVEHPYATVRNALDSPGRWCELMILHLNTKSCRVSGSTPAPVLMVHIGKKDYQELDQASRVDFTFRRLSATPEYLRIRLDAAEGPFGTSDYSIMLQAVPIGADKTFLHLHYSYRYGLAARLAMQTYLATLGRGKSGFTVTGKQANGEPAHVSGMRGALERNTMRYYLAIDAYLSALDAPPARQVETRLNNWFTATEQYFQLYEVSRTSYMDMKRREIQRQQAR